MSNKYSLKSPILLQYGGDIITRRKSKQHRNYPYVEHLNLGGWFIPILDYSDELNLEVMKLIKKYFDTSNHILEMPYAFAGKDIPELHAIAGEPSAICKDNWFTQKEM